MRTVLLVLAAALLVGCGGDANPGTASDDLVPPLHPAVDGYGERLLQLDGTELAVLVADEAAERRHGLMEVEELPDGVGMLFVYEQDRRGGFWMKDTLVPLSIAFTAVDGTILEILDMTPCPAGDDCPSYRPSTPYRYAIEVPHGWFERSDIGPGDVVRGLPGQGA